MLGITSARLHDLEIESPQVGAKYELTVDEQVTAFNTFAALEPELRQLRFDVFADIRKMLLGEDQSTTCVWNACDPYTTRAVQGVEGHGQRSNCGRTNKDGIDFVKADREGFERYLALYYAPQDAGGCHGCRFFVMCKGQCPGGSIGGDWRNRSSKCGLWMALFERFEAEIVEAGRTPISLGPHSPPPRTVCAARVGGWTKCLSPPGDRTGPGRHGPRMIAGAFTNPPSPMDVFRRDRLKHVLPDFTRISWVSDAARAAWEPRLESDRDSLGAASNGDRSHPGSGDAP